MHVCLWAVVLSVQRCNGIRGSLVNEEAHGREDSVIYQTVESSGEDLCMGVPLIKFLDTIKKDLLLC